jgi:restriction system protein
MLDGQIPSDSQEFIRSLLQPQPYMLFCDKLRKFTSKEFIRLVSDLFRQFCDNAIIGPAGADEAIDILCKTSEGEYIVQCKRWQKKVGVPTVREVYGAAVKHQALGAFIVTISEFTSAARWFIIDLRPPPVRFIDGKELFDLMNQHLPTVVADILEDR